MNVATMETQLKGVFAAGDAVTGPSSVVEAMASGRKAALSIDRYVRGQELVPHRILREKEILQARADFRQAKRHRRAWTTAIPLERRSRTFDAVDVRYDPEVAREEADRCLRCGTAVEYYRECWYCLPCEIECPEQALRVEIPYLLR